MIVREGLLWAREVLAEAGCDTPVLDAELLMAKVLGVDRTHLLIEPERQLSESEEAQFRELVSRRKQREPLPYILGEWEFYGLKLEVSPAALIPRPETETLVEVCLSRLQESVSPSTLHAPPRRSAMADSTIAGADVGCGSGAIAIALANSRPDLHIIATDSSEEALNLAHRNVEHHHLQDRFTLLHGNLLDPLLSFDWPLTSGPWPLAFIAANLPYIPSAIIPTLQPEVRDYEPRDALDGGPDGLDAIRRLIAQAPQFLTLSGFLALEISPEQAEEVTRMMEANGFGNVEVVKDLARRERVIAGYLAG